MKSTISAFVFVSQQRIQIKLALVVAKIANAAKVPMLMLIFDDVDVDGVVDVVDVDDVEFDDIDVDDVGDVDVDVSFLHFHTSSSL